MGKRSKGKTRRRKSGPITRRDPEEKRARREAQERERPEGRADQDGAAEDDQPDEPAEDEQADDEREDDDDPAEHSDQAEAPAAAEGADWARPLLALEKRWTWLEVRLLFAALMALTLVLSLWVCLRGMKEPLQAKEAAGTLFRAIVGASALGGLARYLTRKRLQDKQRTWITVGAVVVGIATAKLWRGIGIDYFSGFYDWLQEGSSITLMGGLLGVSTRLTMAVALIGASLAAASGQHINIDIVIRFIPEKLRHAVHILGAVATALVCLMASWGLFDHVAVAEYRIQAELPAGEKVGRVTSEVGEQFFAWRKQVKLDLGALPRVIGGGKWNDPDRMSGRQWNEFLDSEGFVERYGAEAVAQVRAPEESLDSSWTPFVVVPGRDARGILLPGMDLIFPLSFLMIGLRFLLRALLVAGGFIKLETDVEDSDEPTAAEEEAS
jgi:TRAP-type C4-dicarboxylate transport system permease small subunit